MRSMTGFGRGIRQGDGLTCTVEVKSVNARYCDINVRGNNRGAAFEPKVRQMIQEHLHRGKVDVAISWQDMGSRPKTFHINSAMKRQIQEMLVREGFCPSIQAVSLDAVLAVSSDWIQIQDCPDDEMALGNLVEGACLDALSHLVSMRETEGLIIQKDLLERADCMLALVEKVDARKDIAITKYRGYLRERIQGVLDECGGDFHEERFIQEVAIVADKTDITEEIVRFKSHVVQLKNTLASSDVIGRKLDFLIQEMNREVNTMGSKASDMTITDYVVQLKCELEKVREQVQNIE